MEKEIKVHQYQVSRQLQYVIADTINTKRKLISQDEVEKNYCWRKKKNETDKDNLMLELIDSSEKCESLLARSSSSSYDIISTFLFLVQQETLDTKTRSWQYLWERKENNKKKITWTTKTFSRANRFIELATEIVSRPDAMTNNGPSLA